MTKILRSLFVVLLLCTIARVAEAGGGPKGRVFGLGLEVGVPTGITGKVFLGDVPALAFGVGFAWPFGGFGGWLDLDLHFLKIKHKREDVLTLRLYTGPGIQLGWSGAYWYAAYPRGPVVVVPGGVWYSYGYFGGTFAMAIRAPFGLTIHWTKQAFDTFVETGIAVYILPAVAPVAVFPAAIFSVGGRYYF
ncbi:MAG: hypothetical protein IT381_00990 [Deltaproteobacteria bacterium]|nr:hypothetical protein [Deltaproteobacteria bacterium]